MILWIRKFSRDFYLAIFSFSNNCEFLNSRASIRVVSHFRGIKIGIFVFHAKDK